MVEVLFLSFPVGTRLSDSNDIVSGGWNPSMFHFDRVLIPPERIDSWLEVVYSYLVVRCIYQVR